MDEIIILDINGKTGEIEVQTQGFKGKTCESAVDKILVGLGGQTVASKHTSEYYEDGDNPVEVLMK